MDSPTSHRYAPCMSPVLRKRLTPAGLVTVACNAESLQQAADSEPEGVYTVSNTQQGHRVLFLDAHLDRLEESAAREGFPLYLPRARLRHALRNMIDEAGFGEMRFRLCVPRAAPQELLITLEPWQPPPERLQREGLRCVVAPGLKRDNPAAKRSSWLQERQRFSLPAGCQEALLRDAEGQILEGLSSSFFAVLAGELRTAGAGVLAGITRGIVLQLAPDILPLRLTPVRLDELPQLGEAFLSSSSRGLLPIVQIDGQVIGDGRPGRYTCAISQAFQRYVKAHLQEL